MKPTRGTANPPEGPEPITTDTPCACPGCSLHTGPCLAKHLHRYPATRTIVHLKATEDGPLCPFCLLASTRPGSNGTATRAALRRPCALGEQDDLFDVAPYAVEGREVR